MERDFVARDWSALICSYEWDCGIALTIVYGGTPHCPNGESSGKAGVESVGGHRGLFQIAPIHIWRFVAKGWTWAQAFVAEMNVAIAYELYLESGWQPWSCRP